MTARPTTKSPYDLRLFELARRQHDALLDALRWIRGEDAGRKHRHWEYEQAKYVKNGQTDTIRLNWILLNVLEGQRFGGDLKEMREGIDAAMSWEESE